MTREELRTLGLTDEQVDAVMKSHGKDINDLNAKVITATNELARLKDVEKDFADFKLKNPEPQKIDPELQKALDRIKELELASSRKDITSYLLEKGISGDDSVNILNAFGTDIDITKKAIDSIAQIISNESNKAVELKVQELAKGSTNPGAGSSGNNGGTEKSNAEQFAESLVSNLGGGAKASSDIISSYK